MVSSNHKLQINNNTEIGCAATEANQINETSDDAPLTIDFVEDNKNNDNNANRISPNMI